MIRNLRRQLLLAMLCSCTSFSAWAWGQEGHAVVAEIAQRRLSPAATAAVEHLLGRGHSLAAVASWADDMREARPETYRWHFVSIPRAAPTYEAARDCAATTRGDCVVAQLERLKNDLRCAATADLRRDALRYAVHFVGDIHQPLHAVGDERGGNLLMVRVEWRGLTCLAKCVPKRIDANFHAVWDSHLINSVAWNWGAYVNRLEGGWLAGAEARAADADGGSAADWANATHTQGQAVWDLVPPTRVLDDSYFQQVLPVVDRQLGLAGLRLARFLNEAYETRACAAR